MPHQTEEIQAYFGSLISSHVGIFAIVLSDREGVIVEQAKTSNCPQGMIQPGILATVAVACEQAGKLDIGNNKSAVVFYDTYQIVHYNCAPFVVSFFADVNANTAVLMDLNDTLCSTLEPLIRLLSSM